MKSITPRYINPAVRLYPILHPGSTLPDNMATLKAWALLFHIGEPYDIGLSSDVSERLLWLNQELEALKRQLHSLKLDQEHREPILKHIEQALSPVYLATNWDAVKQFLSADTIAALQRWAEALLQVETPIDPEELQAILAQAEEMINALDSFTLAEELSLLIPQQVRSIRKAITRYPLSGARALKEATFTAYGELMDVEDRISENCHVPEIKKLIDIWQQTYLLASSAMVKERDVASRNPWKRFCPGFS